jgi:hypothetical protein
MIINSIKERSKIKIFEIINDKDQIIKIKDRAEHHKK